MLPRDRNQSQGVGHRGLRFSLSARPGHVSNPPSPYCGTAIHSPLARDARVYRGGSDTTEGNITTECGYCGLFTPVWGLRTILTGHLIQVCPECRKGAAKCGCGTVVKPAWIPMSKRVPACGVCAEAYDAVYLKASQCVSKSGAYYEPYLDDSQSPMRKRSRAKQGPSQEALAFYGMDCKSHAKRK